MEEYRATCLNCKKEIDVHFKKHQRFVFLNCYHCKASLSVCRKTSLEILLLGKPGLKEASDESDM